MNEPRVVESVTNECQSLGRAHESSSARADELIACLEGEIAKRDEAISRLEADNRSKNGSLKAFGEQIAGLQKAVRNRERLVGLRDARILELESRYQRDVFGLNNEGDPIGGDPAGGYANDNARLRAELAAIKAQGVVMPERWNVPRPMWKDARQPYGNPLNHADIEAAEKFNLALDEVARLNAAPVQQVSVPGGWRVERGYSPSGYVLHSPSGSMIRVCDSGGGGIETAFALFLKAMLIAAPAADAGIVDMYRHLQTVTPYRFKKIQDASVTDGGDVLYFHKDRFDAALLADMAAHCAAKGGGVMAVADIRGKTVECKCERCKQPFIARVADRKRGWARFCSKSCKAIRQEAKTGQHSAYQDRKARTNDGHCGGEFNDAHLFSNEDHNCSKEL